MDTTVKRLKANRLIEGKTCPWCNENLAYGDATAVCGACQGPHHDACWDRHGGCATVKCAHAPLQRMADAQPKTAAKPGTIECPHCQRSMPETARFCRHCKKAPTPDGVYDGPKQNAPGATASLVLGILSLLLCGLIFGIIALLKASQAKKAIARDPTLGGAGLATAGQLLGIVGLVGWGIIMFVNLASR